MDILRGINDTNDTILKINGLFDHSGAGEWGITERTISDNMLVMARGGSGGYVIDGCCYPIQRGRIYIISHDVLHSSFQSNANPVSVIAIRFSMESTTSDQECFPLMSFVYDPMDQNTLFGILSGLCKQVSRFTVSGINPAICGGVLDAFFKILASDLSYYTTGGSFDSEMESISMLLDDNIYTGEKTQLRDILATVNLSHYEFSVRFIKYFGITFREYLFKKRIDYAANLLQTTNRSIKEVAAIIGYSDQYIFSNQFKQIYHLSPKEFRKQRGRNAKQIFPAI